jgi:hypothetical protein
MPAINLYAGPLSICQHLFLLFQVVPAGLEGIPDGTYFWFGLAGT